MCWLSICSFEVGAEYIRVFKFPTFKKIKDWVNMLSGCASKTSLDVNLFPSFGARYSLLEMIQAF